MRICLMMIIMNLSVLFIISFLLGPVPVWVGGIIGVCVFIGIGSLVAKFVE